MKVTVSATLCPDVQKEKELNKNTANRENATDYDAKSHFLEKIC